MSDEQSKLDPFSPQKLRFWVIWGVLSFGWALVLGYALSDGHSHKLGIGVGMGIIVGVTRQLSAWAVSIPHSELSWRKSQRVDLPDRVR
jgi:hypothetical protein